MYQIGQKLTAGVLDEASGKGQTKGIEGVADKLLERALLQELGHQLGEGLRSGVTQLTPEQKADLETTVDSLIAVAAKRTGKGLREEVSPELREMVRKDIVQTFVEGVRGDLGDSLEEAVDKMVLRASEALKRAIDDPDLHESFADLLRDSMHQAMREGRPGSPAMGETLQVTLDEHVFRPFEASMGGVGANVEERANNVADRVDASARRTEGALKTVISALVIILGVFVLLFLLTRRQLARAKESSEVAQQGLRSMGAALDILDEGSRSALRDKLEEYQNIAPRRAQLPSAASAPPRAPPGKEKGRSDAYERKDR